MPPSPVGTSTVVPTTLPSPTPTPPPSYFTEDFESEPWYWQTFMTGSTGSRPEPGVRADDGYLVFTLPQPFQWVYRVLSAHTYADVHIEARFEPRASEPSSAGLVCRYDPGDGWYEFNVSRDGQYSVLLGKWQGPGIATYAPLLNGVSEYITPAERAFEIGLTCEGQTLWLSVNGKVIRKLDVSGTHLKAGWIGVSAASFQNVPVISAFDWVRLAPPD